MEMMDEVLSSVGAQDMDTSGYQVSDLEDIECHWESPDFNMNAVFRPGVDTSVSPSTFNDFEICSVTENPFRIHEEQHEENSSFSNNSSLQETSPIPCVDETSPLWNHELRTFRILFIEICLNNSFYRSCVCILI